MTDPSQAAAAGRLAPGAFEALFESVNRSDAPGLVVGVSHRGRVLFRRGYGMACVALGVSNTPATRMRIGSTTKHFTCLAALLLAEDGLLDIDAPVRDHLPELPDLGADPTLRQLMTHTSGVRCYLDLHLLAGGLAVRPVGDVLRNQLRQSSLNFAPGEDILYCNGGYQLLSEVIARTAGMAFERVLRERIFEPMGMHDTESLPDDLTLHRGLATLHLPRPGGGYERGIFPTRETRGEGAMVSTVDDMLKWLAHLRRPTVVGSASTWRQMLQTTRLRNGLPIPYALGLMRHDHRGVEVVHHAGGVIGGCSQMLTVPAHELDIVMMLNGAPLNPMDLAYRIIERVLGPEVLGPEGRKVPAERFRPLVGARYRDRASRMVIEFSDQAGQLALTACNLMPVPLHDTGESIRLGFEDMAAMPIECATTDLPAAGDAAPESLAVKLGGNLRLLDKLPEPPPPNRIAGVALAGRYRSADLAVDAEVTLDGETLTMRVQGDAPAVRYQLQALDADVFAWEMLDLPGPPMKGLLDVHREGGAVRGFHLQTSRTRQLWFARLGGAGYTSDHSH